jgi:hypothetical protein
MEQLSLRFTRDLWFYIKISIEVIEMYGSSDAARVTEKVLGQLLWNPPKIVVSAPLYRKVVIKKPQHPDRMPE